MKQIEKEMTNAVNSKVFWKKSNTETRTTNHGKNVFVFLFDNCIYAQINGRKYFSDCGWKTPTTASRLNALGFPGGYSWSAKATNKGLSKKNLQTLYIKTLFGL